MRHLDLFSGIGGFALAARRVGWETVAFCENDPWCGKVLNKNFPGVPVYTDVRKLYRFADEYEPCPDCDEPYCELCEAHFADCDCVGCSEFDDDIGEIDILTAGWPCQDISVAGKGAGLAGERSGLWRDVARIIGAIRPRYAVMENVSALLARGLGDVLGDLAEVGYDCEWHCIPASAAGAPHRRDRIWIIAYPQRDSLRVEQQRLERGAAVDGQAEPGFDGEARPVAEERTHSDGRGFPLLGVEKYAALESQRRHESDRLRAGGRRSGPNGPYPGCQFLEGWQPQGPTDRSQLWGNAEWWATEPDVGRVANGVPSRVDRLRGLGNAIVPQVAEALFRMLDS